MNNNEQNNKKKTAGVLLSILSIISLVLITAGVTYAFFSYAKEGLTENVITTGKITFYYDEQRKEGNGITIENAVPISDTNGKLLNEAGNKFTFQVTSTNTGTTPIKYKITARRTDDSNLSDSAVKLYLESSGHALGNDSNKTVVNDKVQTFGELDKYDNEKNYNEKIIYEEQISDTNKANYVADFTLRMWLAQNDEEGTNTEADYSAYEFVKKELTSDAAQDEDGAYDADALIKAKDFITSTDYYKLTTDARAAYERIAYVDQTARKVIPASVAQTKTYVTVNDDGTITENEGTKLVKENFKFGEQFYQLNEQKFSVIVNVYANAEVVQ